MNMQFYQSLSEGDWVAWLSVCAGTIVLTILAVLLSTKETDHDAIG